jgi:hypothetical protein
MSFTGDYMKGFFTGFKLKLLLAVVFITSFSYVDVLSQSFINNTGGTYEVPSSAICGTIKIFSTSDSVFAGAEALGRDESNRIPGTVEFTGDSSGMKVQTSLPNTNENSWYYTNLLLSNTDGIDVGNAGDTIFVSGSYTLGGSAGDRTYAGYFNYDGDDAQEILAENGAGGTNSYVNLHLTGGANAAKTISGGDSVVVDGTFLHNAASGFDITDGAFSLVDDTDATINQNVNINGSGTSFNILGTSGANIASNSTFTVELGTLNNSATGDSLVVETGSTLNLVDENGELNLAANSETNIIGSFTNGAADGSRTNLDADTASTVYYSGDAQTLIATDYTNPFGNLVFNTTNGITAGDSVHVNNDLSVNDDVDATGGQVVMMENDQGDNNIFYTNDTEIEGYVAWRDITAGSFKQFNNANTGMQFETAPNGTTTPFVALNVTQATAPDNASDYDAAEDVNRRIEILYSGDAQIDTLSFGWDASEDPSGGVATMRFAEGYDSNDPKQKLTRQGNEYNLGGTGSDPRWVGYGGGSGNGINLWESPTAGQDNSSSDRNFFLADGSQILLTNSSANMISVQSGRWTDPDTWDEGRAPESTDTVEIEHVVYTGDNSGPWSTQAFDDDEAQGVNWALKIYVNDISGAALVVGNQDSDMGGINDDVLFGTEYVANSGIVNRNTNANTWTRTAANTTGLNGVYILTCDDTDPTFPATFKPVFSVRTFENAGAVVNESVIEIGK